MCTVSLIIILSISSTTMAYRDGARTDSCYGHEVVHLTFGVAALPTICADPCSYTLTVVSKVGDENIEGSISSYDCGQTYLLHINYSRNAFEGFLVQARDVSGTFDENSSIYGTFLEDESFLYKPLMCGVNMFDESEVFPNSATQKERVNEESYVPLYWRAPDPVSFINQLPDQLTFWFTIVKQQQTYFFPIEGPTLVRDTVSCTLPTTTELTTDAQTTHRESRVNTSTTELPRTTDNGGGAPTLDVTVSDITSRILDVSPYNTFSLTCTSTSRVNGIARALTKTVQWMRSIDSSQVLELSSSTSEFTISSSNLDQVNSTSTITVNADTAGDHTYTCLVSLDVSLATDDINGQDSTNIDVQGPVLPEVPTGLIISSISHDRATIQWTVTSIAYDPETYIVQYGTASNSLTSTSRTVSSGNDITRTNFMLSVKLTGLTLDNRYYYQVMVTNTAGSTTSTAPPATFITSGLQPVITAMFSGATPTIGESYSLTCTATGADQLNPTITYQWFKDNTVVTGETQSTLSFSSLSLSNTGQYRCDVTVSSALLHRKIFNSSHPYQLVIPTVLFQIRLNGIPNCHKWALTNTAAKIHDIVTTLVQVVEQACECGFTRDHITEDAFQCFPESQQHVTFRARLKETSQASIPQLIAYIEQWAITSKIVTIRQFRLGIKNTCDTVVNDFFSPECPQKNIITPPISMDQDSAIFQLKFGQTDHCITWNEEKANEINSNIQDQVLQTVKSRCLCKVLKGNLLKGVFSCLDSHNQTTYRSTIIGTQSYNATELVEFIQDWVTSGPTMTIQWYTVKLDPKCPVSISSLGDPECGQNEKESSYLDDPNIARCVDVCIARSSP